MTCALPKDYDELVTARTLVSAMPTRSFIVTPPRTSIPVVPTQQKHGIKWALYLPLMLLIALLSGASTYGYSYMKHPNIPASCIESIYILERGQSATCHDPRSHIDIISKAQDISFMCACNK